MATLDYSLRPVTTDDKELIYSWRNRPEVRTYMYTSSEIPRDEHERWFVAMLEDSSKHWLILNTRGMDCAVLCFVLNDGGRTSSWGFYSGPSAPAGVSLLIELAGLEFAFEELGVQRLHCEVLSGNQQVVNLHQKTGFSLEGCLRQARTTPRGIEDVLVFGMLDDEWPTAREQLRNRVARFFSPPNQPGL